MWTLHNEQKTLTISINPQFNSYGICVNGQHWKATINASGVMEYCYKNGIKIPADLLSHMASRLRKYEPRRWKTVDRRGNAIDIEEHTSHVDTVYSVMYKQTKQTMLDDELQSFCHRSGALFPTELA